MLSGALIRAPDQAREMSVPEMLAGNAQSSCGRSDSKIPTSMAYYAYREPKDQVAIPCTGRSVSDGSQVLPPPFRCEWNASKRSIARPA